MFVEFLALSSLVCVLLYVWITQNNDFFKKRGIPYNKPNFLFGSMKDLVMRKRDIADVCMKLYNQHNGKAYGIFDQRNPILMARDPELIKQIAVKEFDHFMNHRPQFKPEENDTDTTNLFGRSLFAMENETWRSMRTTLSPAFTGSKMRHMFQLINQVATAATDYIKEQPGGKSAAGVELELKDFSTRITSDIIATTAFGLDVNSLKHKDNEFYQMGKRVTNFTALQNLKFFFIANFKALSKYFKMRLFDQKDTDYFMRLVLDTMNYRKENNISRPDMINMLMEARGLIKTEQQKSTIHEWSDFDMVAQCFVFFFAGFETTSVLMCFAAYELMLNADIQQRLYEEIVEIDQELQGQSVTYEALMKMTYMNMVVSETLRLWPAAVFVDRQCNEDFLYEKDGERIEVRKGEIVWIPVWGIQHDPKYYENPDKFDPERFNEENSSKINAFNYMPFGVGPRICIGSRLALLEAKAFLYYLVRDFQIVRGAQTVVPLVLKKGAFQLTSENGFWMKLVPRNLNK